MYSAAWKRYVALTVLIVSLVFIGLALPAYATEYVDSRVIGGEGALDHELEPVGNDPSDVDEAPAEEDVASEMVDPEQTVQTDEADDLTDTGSVSSEAPEDAVTTTAKEPEASESELAIQGNAASGMCGTVSWSVDSSGVLTLGKQGESGTLAQEKWEGKCRHYYPWNERKDIKKFVVLPGVKAEASIEGLCSYLPSLTYADLSGLDTSSVWDFGELFRECTSLTSVRVSSLDTSFADNMQDMFMDCSSLTSVDISGWDTGELDDIWGMFSGCSKLTSVDLSAWNTSALEVVDSMFAGCVNLKSISIGTWDTSSLREAYDMFSGCSSLAELDVSKWNTSSLIYAFGMFRDCSSLTSLDVSNWDTSSLTQAHEMFSGCTKLSSLDPSRWDTSSMESCGDMFRNCSSLTSLDLSRWDTSSFTSTGWAFYGCTNLRTVKLANWDVTSVTCTQETFKGCSSLTEIDLSGWNTSSLAYLAAMFDGCTKLKTLDLSSWDSSKSVVMRDMFLNCASLTTVKLSNKFSFCGRKSSRQCSLPAGTWESMTTGTKYTEATMPNNVADTYRLLYVFPDVPASHWASYVIGRASTLGLFSGNKDGSFGPDDSITRGQLAVVLWNMAGKPKAQAGAKTFSDVAKGKYYYEAVRWASSKGIVNGYSSGKFGPNDKVTREQMSVMIGNYAAKVRLFYVSGSRADFASMSDAKSVANWATKSMAWCFRNKLISGSGGKIKPKGYATRAQVAKVLVVLYDIELAC